MTKEQEEAIKFLELHTDFIGKLDKGRCIRIPEENFTKTKQSIEILLNMLKEKDTEIEKYKNLLASNLAKNLNDSIKAKEKANTDLEFLNLGWKTEIEKKDKMIDLLVDKVNQGCKVFEKGEIKEIIEIYEKIKNTSDLRGLELRKNCIKEYFERKVEQSSSKTQEKN